MYGLGGGASWGSIGAASEKVADPAFVQCNHTMLQRHCCHHTQVDEPAQPTSAASSREQLPPAASARHEGAPQPFMERIFNFLLAERLVLRQHRDDSAEESQPASSIGALFPFSFFDSKAPSLVKRLMPARAQKRRAFFCIQADGVLGS